MKTRPISASSDVNWANDQIDRKSVTGGYITYHGMPISWTSKKHTAGAMSTADAEYRPMADVLLRAVYVKQLATTFEIIPQGMTMENDNMPALTMVRALGRLKDPSS